MEASALWWRLTAFFVLGARSGRLWLGILQFRPFAFWVNLYDNSGIGQTYWQVILGRLIAGCGASGMISLASIIITGELTLFLFLFQNRPEGGSTDQHKKRLPTLQMSQFYEATSISPRQLDSREVARSEDFLLELLVGDGKLHPVVVVFFVSQHWYFWRLFLGQVPIAAACCLLMSKNYEAMCPKTEQEEERQREEPVLAFDFAGAITLAIAISSFLAVIDLQGSLSWEHPLIHSLVVVGILSTIAFLTFETFPGNRELLMPLKLLKTEIGAFCAGQVLDHNHGDYRMSVLTGALGTSSCELLRGVHCHFFSLLIH